jgi:hypothetical protein
MGDEMSDNVIDFEERPNVMRPPVCSGAGYAAVERVLARLWHSGPAPAELGGVQTDAEFLVGELDDIGFRVVPK